MFSQKRVELSYFFAYLYALTAVKPSCYKLITQNTKPMNMKRKYLSPEVEVDLVAVERNFLDSTRSASSTMNLGVEDVDDDDYWN